MSRFYYADIGNWLTLGYDLSQWGLPVYVAVTADYAYRSVEVRLLCLYVNVSWTPSDTNGEKPT